ncbi:MAG TPA: peptidylprolyl isomerase [Candidatus Limnocylindrales bacterium]|nr:peptidylprolyl isomerase [Candidatus Limnocylindrales bacterium]
MTRSFRLPVAPTIIAVALAFALLTAACSTAGGGSSPRPSATKGADASPGTGSSACPTAQPDPLPAGEKRVVTIETAKGTIAITIEADLSPIAAGNFVALAGCGYYDGIVFHRVLPGFVIQGGDPTGTGRGGPGYTIEDEDVTVPYVRGTVAMARTPAPNSVGSQFFIVLDDSAAQSLAAPTTNNYQIIGSVTEGMEAVDAIAAAADAELPTSPIVMDRVTVGTP